MEKGKVDKSKVNAVTDSDEAGTRSDYATSGHGFKNFPPEVSL